MEIPALDNVQDLGDSMLEEIRRTAEKRLHQIEPLLEEAQRLRGVLEALEAPLRLQIEERRAATESTIGERRGARARPNGHRARRQPDSGSRAAKGSNKRAILALVAERPGITAAQIADATGMKRTVVASTVSRLKRYGELLEHESGGVCVPAATESAKRSAARTTARTRLRHLSARQAA